MTIDQTSSKPSKTLKLHRSRVALYIPQSSIEALGPWQQASTVQPPKPSVSPVSTGSAIVISLEAERQRRLRPMRLAG
jgi:hypothetical protein